LFFLFFCYFFYYYCYTHIYATLFFCSFCVISFHYGAIF
jgi:hypothetical protein